MITEIASLLAFPSIDPVLLQVGPFAIRWYSLSYIAGVLLGWWYIGWLNRLHPAGILNKKALEDITIWAILGIILGGRLGYVLFYKPGYYMDNPSEILSVWEGGMSFHGGLLGVIIAFIFFARRYKIHFFDVMDMVACATPIGLFLGRVANFINGELYGRTTDAAWGMVFPGGGIYARHPSQLYEAALEGILLFLVLYFFARFSRAKEYRSMLSGIFLVGYGAARAFCEFFREPDAHLGFIGSFTMGQLLCIPMALYGIYLIRSAISRGPTARAA